MQFPAPAQRTFAICRSILWLASWLAPARERSRWRADWTKRAWHWCMFLAESGSLNRKNKLELANFCWSAFPAAWWTRFDREPFLRGVDRTRRSPSFCLAAIALLALVLLPFSGIVSVVRAFVSSPLPHPERVQVISLNGKFRRVRSETLLDLAEAWKHSKLIEDVAPYSWAPARLQTPSRGVPILEARVAPEFFQVLGLNAALGRTFDAGDGRSCYDCVVLSDEIWRLQFGGKRSVIGQQV